MGAPKPPLDSDSVSLDWQQIEEMLDQLAQASKSAATRHEFYHLLLKQVVQAFAASGGAIWTSAGGEELRLENQINLAAGTSTAARPLLASHQAIVEEVLRTGKPRVAPPHSDTANIEAEVNPTESWLICHPFQRGEQARGAIEIILRRSASFLEAREYQRVLDAVVEVADDFHRNLELAELRDHRVKGRDVEGFALRVHRSLDVDQTAFMVVNDARRIIGCDRVSVLIVKGTQCRAVAISGVDALDRRAKVVQKLERLAARAIASGDVVWYFDGMDDVPVEISQPLEAYLDESHVRVLAIVPLVEPGIESDRRPPRVLGALVAEQFQAAPSTCDLRELVTAVASHASVALGNAILHSRMPLAGLGRLLSRMRPTAESRFLPKTALALATAAAIAAALVFVKADFNIQSPGELQPERRRDVFATNDGQVSELLADHGTRVRFDQPLAVIRNPQLDLELGRVAGEIQTAQKKLAAVQAERLENAPQVAAARRSPHQLTADEEELKELLKGLYLQRDIIEQQIRDLVVRSPIDGQALTWNLKRHLESRPVERGQTLMTVGDLEGPWVLELHVPDNRAGHVLQARDEIEPGLEVSFALLSDPGTTYRGRIVDVAMSTELDEATSPTVLVTVGFDRNEVTGLRPGATVTAQIHCGRRALGYVWTIDLIEFVKSHWWW
jgi:multidrug efflux pump subunit AcrA (membrane-fusion protein)